LSRVFGLSIAVLILLGSSSRSDSTDLLLDRTLFFIGCLMAAVGFFGRLWCLSYIAGRKKKVLVTAGPYSLCRHPLYLFSLIGGVGLGFCTQTFTIPLLFLFAFAVYYPFAIRGEEEFLASIFPEYEEYKKRVPAFFPRWSNFVEADVLQVNACSFRRELVGRGLL
jgi:protein-S-isoprenylcysteine O-methyltransferase Ste14